MSDYTFRSFEEDNLHLFRGRFKMVRQGYKLTLAETADLLGLRSRSAISELENGNKKLSLEAILQFTKVFGVSLDWLLGNTETRYLEVQLMLIEENHLSICHFLEYYSLGVFKNAHDFQWIPEEYSQFELREATYSLPVRANICYLMHCCLVDALLYAIQFNFIDDEDYIHNLHKALATLIRCDITNTEQQLKRGDYFSNISRSKQNFDELRDLIMAKDKAEPIYIF
ncbi:MAG: helix-turn-helix domain-containing protein [Phascolarctobacterium sp.]